MSIKKIRPGKALTPEESGVTHMVDYTHLLPLASRQMGYKIRVTSENNNFDGDDPFVFADLVRRGAQVGRVEGQITGTKGGRPKPALEIISGEIDGDHRGNGRGTALYEALMAHAHHTHKAKRVRGEAHSTMAEKVHQKITNKHGIRYKGQPNLDVVGPEEKANVADDLYPDNDEFDPINVDTREAWRHMEPAPYDGRYEPYSYALKSEAPLDEALDKSVGYVAFPKMGIPGPRSKVMTMENTAQNRDRAALKQKLQGRGQLHGIEDAPMEGFGVVATGGDEEHGLALEGAKASLNPIQDHEAQHTIFGEIGRNYGRNHRSLVANLTVNAMDDDAYEAGHMVAKTNGYSYQDPEEIVALHINYLTDPKMRASLERNLSPLEKEVLRHHMKRGWKQMREFAQNYVHVAPGGKPYDKLARSEIFEEKVRKSQKPLVIPDRYKEQTLPVEFAMDPNLLETEVVAKAQMGFNANIQEVFEAAKMISGSTDIPLTRMVKAYSVAEEDIERAALEAYGVKHTPENLSALHTSLYGLSKALDVASMVQSYQIQPATQDATDMAEAIQRGAQRGYINPVKLNGKHSKGAMVVKDPVDRKMYLLKPGAGKNSPALGVSEDLSSQSEREAAFWHVADAVGLGEFYPKADLVLVNGHQTAAMELLPTNYRNLGDKKKEDPNIGPRVLTPYLKDGTLHQWAFMDYLLGNPDRHSQNIMVDPDGKLVKLIDHGSAMAGNSFDPVNDPDSFIPYYLRAWTGRKFTTMSPRERMRAMPSMDPQTSKGYDIWIKDMPDHQIAAILEEYHVNPQPALRRLAQIRATPGPKWQVVNKLWSGEP